MNKQLIAKELLKIAKQLSAYDNDEELLKKVGEHVKKFWRSNALDTGIFKEYKIIPNGMVLSFAGKKVGDKIMFKSIKLEVRDEIVYWTNPTKKEEYWLADLKNTNAVVAKLEDKVYYEKTGVYL